MPAGGAERLALDRACWAVGWAAAPRAGCALHLAGSGLGRRVVGPPRGLRALAGGAVALLGSALLLRMAW